MFRDAKEIFQSNMLRQQGELIQAISYIRRGQSFILEALDTLSDCDLSGIDQIDNLNQFDVSAYSASNSLAEMNRLLCGWLSVVAQDSLHNIEASDD